MCHTLHPRLTCASFWLISDLPLVSTIKLALQLCEAEQDLSAEFPSLEQQTHEIASFTKDEIKVVRDMLKGQQGESSGSPSTSVGGGGDGATAAGF